MIPFWEDRTPEIGTLDKNESGGICDMGNRSLDDNKRRLFDEYDVVYNGIYDEMISIVNQIHYRCY
jgi:hypothetical protein